MDIQQHNLFKAIQEQILCPISKTPIKDPVVTADGHTYERGSIQFWFASSNKSPKTNLSLASTSLIQNIFFKSLVEKLNYIIPKHLSNQEKLKHQIQDLKQEISDLKEQLEHQEQIYQQTIEISEKELKVKRISKDKYENKRKNLRLIRQEKQKYYKLYQELKLTEYELKKKGQNQSEQIDKNNQAIKKYKQQLDSLNLTCNKLKQQKQESEKGNKQVISVLNKTLNTSFRRYVKYIDIISKSLSTFEESQTIKKLQKQLQKNFILSFKSKQQKNQNLNESSANNGRMNEEQNQNHLNQPIIQSQSISQSIQNIKSQRCFAQYDVFKSISWLVKDINIQQMLPNSYYILCPKKIQFLYQKKQIHNYGLTLKFKQFSKPFDQFINYFWGNIKHLNLQKCNIDDNGLFRFFNNIYNFKNLSSLNLRQNKLTKFALQNLQKLPKLKGVNLILNNLGEETKNQLQDYNSSPDHKVQFFLKEINSRRRIIVE